MRDEVLAAERATLDDAVRADPARMGALLDDEFVEFGQSGRIWDRTDVLAMLVAAAPLGRVELTDEVVVPLGPDTALLTYRLVAGGRTSLRSSVWIRGGVGWQLRFHQGTSVG